MVFGEPIMAEDMWQMHRIHEVSRRRNGECGLDVIVAAATQRQGSHHKRQLLMSAEEASRKLVELAREFDPNGALATHSIFEDIPLTAEIAGVDEDLRLRSPSLECLQPFEAAHQTDRLPPEPTPPGGALATRATRQPTVRQSVTGATWTFGLPRTGARRSAASGPALMKWKKRSISAGWVVRALVSGLVVR